MAVLEACHKANAKRDRLHAEKARAKTEVIIIRGCRVRISASKVGEFRKMEEELMQADWAANRVD